jgi:hypothetical protein
MADEAVIAAAAAGLWYLLRGKKRSPREEAELPAVTGPQPKAIPALRAEALPPVVRVDPGIVPVQVPMPPAIAAALRDPAPPVQTFQTVAPPAPVPVAPRAPEQRFNKPRFRASRIGLMPMADLDHTHPPMFPTFLK